MSQRQFPRRLPITLDQRIHQIFMLVGSLIASISQDIAEMKEPLTFFKCATDCLGQSAIARGISNGGMENEECAPDQNESPEHRFHYAMSRIAMAAHACRLYKQKER